MRSEPLIMALDSSHLKGSVAVSRGEDILCEVLFDAGDTHSATLMPAVDICLKTAKVGLDEMDRFGVVSGPGSFTGLRIGLATVKAFAVIRKRPVVTVPGLEVLAAALPFASNLVFPLIDARREEVYGAVYTTDSGIPRELIPPFSSKPEMIRDILKRAGLDHPVIFCGTGSHRYRDLLDSIAPTGSRFSGAKFSIPSASNLAVLALDREPVPYEELAALEPLYIRPPDARLPMESRLKEGGGR